ncbi:RagB/SusD family nutrient uptake outer membrane protein [Sphingobacterium sp. SRCM116780]|uniref:RagB/SusD family nutrient uptake outer membrane protein n=1 Tax=Sphingobacterium sp. SRCM116780 TaxID=2907623 RepID=UPI001F1AE344|nr:RagB/SusD family nutrient uptake outer membrane protein [Sphingobacterium sp. SRCM116780]UIR57334.1 RagB/SusD family nutrient uptake outer membrane protein [Sphingobacterium sp. SRCM116780]
MKKIFIIFTTISFFCCGCAADFLDVKPAKNLVVLSSITDYQALMDRVSILNEKTSQELAIMSIDDYYLLSDTWKFLSSSTQRNAYIWKADVFEGEQSRDWDNGYERIFYANTALEGLAKIAPSKDEEQLWKNVKARALFHRAWNHYNLMMLFGDYTGSIDGAGKGIPLRKASDINIPVTRSTSSETFTFIIDDLKNAVQLFDNSTYHIERPTKYSAFGLLAKIYLYLQDYETAFKYAQLTMEGNYKLIDFNTLDRNKSFPFPSYGVGNTEIVFNAWLPTVASFAQTRLCVDTDLLSLYDNHDLRRTVYFKNNTTGQVTFKGSYVGSSLLFTGISMNEIYLIAMESAVRINKLNLALELYNKLRVNRFAQNHYQHETTVDKNILLNLIWKEKRRELVMRASRWEDLKRLNKSGEHPITLQRIIEGVTYKLTPHDAKYVMPIPDYVVNMSKIDQNPR